MSRRRLAAAVLPLLGLLGCGGSRDDRPLAPAASAAGSPAASSPAAGSPGAAATAAPSSTPPAGQGVPVRKLPPAGPIPTGAEALKPVATVNGKPIPADKVYSVYQMNKQMLQQRGRVLSETDDRALKAESLEVVVADELLYQAALAKGIAVTPAQIDAELKQFKLRVGTDEAYKKFLAESGFTESEVRREIERNIQTESYGKSLVAGKAVSEDQARKFYDANAPKGMFNVPEQVHVQYILIKATEKDPESVRIDARKRAEEAAKRAAAGEDFTALAKQYSQDPTAARGGDIGLFPRGVMFPKFEEVAFSAKPGDVSAVFETPKGFNVMKVLEKKPEASRTFDEVKSALMLDMGRMMEQDILKSKVQELAGSATIAILDPSFTMPPPPPAAGAAAPAAKP